jgi:hypothetical protein
MQCTACGDCAGDDAIDIRGKVYCKECGEELEYGIIGPPPISATPSLIRLHHDNVGSVFELAEKRFEGD